MGGREGRERAVLWAWWPREGGADPNLYPWATEGSSDLRLLFCSCKLSSPIGLPEVYQGINGPLPLPW